MLTTTWSILCGPNWSLPFHIHIDASDYTIETILGVKERVIKYVIYHINKNLQGVKFNYTIIEKELLVVIYALNKFRHYISGYEIFVHIDHSTIKYLMNKLDIFG